MTFTRQALARGLTGVLCDASPIVDGEELLIDTAAAEGADVTIILEDADGRTSGAVLRVIEVWED